MKIEEYRNKTDIELNKELEELVKERFNLRIQRGSGLNPKPHLFSTVSYTHLTLPTNREV